MKTLARQRDKRELLRRLRTLRPDSARRWGRMSAHQMVCHLGDACRMAAGQMQVSHSQTLAQRTLMKWIALHLPLRWPPGIPTRPEIDQEAEGTKPADFATDLSMVETLLELNSQPGTCGTRRHPVFGRLSEAEWLRWGYLHVDHHLRQFGA